MADQTHQTPLEIKRNHAEATLDVHYGIAFNRLNASLYRRIDSLFSLVNVVGGSAAFALVISGTPAIAGWIGLAIAALAYLEREVKPGQKAVLCDAQAERFGDLAGRAPTLDLVDLDRELLRLQSSGPATFDALRLPAYNNNVRSHGYPDSASPTSAWEKLVHWLC